MLWFMQSLIQRCLLRPLGYLTYAHWAFLFIPQSPWLRELLCLQSYIPW